MASTEGKRIMTRELMMRTYSSRWCRLGVKARRWPRTSVQKPIRQEERGMPGEGESEREREQQREYPACSSLP